MAGSPLPGGDRQRLWIGAMPSGRDGPARGLIGPIAVAMAIGIAASDAVNGPPLGIAIRAVITAFVVGYPGVVSAVGGPVGGALADRGEREPASLVSPRSRPSRARTGRGR